MYFTASRDSRVRKALYKVDNQGVVTALTDTSMNVSTVKFSPDGKYFIAYLSNYTTPTQIWGYETASASQAWKARKLISSGARK